MKKKTKMLIIGIALSVVAAVGIVIAVRIITKIVSGGNARRQSSYTIGQMELKKQPLARTLTFRGILAGDPQVKVYPPAPGRFLSNAVSEGDRVTQDQVLTSIDRALVGQDFQPALVRSPIAGMVSKLYFVDRGQPMSIDKPVAEVANTAAVKVVLAVGEDDLAKVKSGADAVITAVDDNTLSLPARVASVTPFVDSDTFSGGIIVKAANRDNRLKIGMSVRVDIITSRGDAYLVPQFAVQTDASTSFIFLNANGTAKRVTVQPGFDQGDSIEVTGDLHDGDLAITDGSFKLFDGARVTIAGQNPDRNGGPTASPGPNGPPGRRRSNGGGGNGPDKPSPAAP